MNAFNAITSAIFDVILAPFGHGPAWFDLLLWPVLCGVIALVIYKHISNQKGIEKVKDQIKAELYEIRLFGHDPLMVIAATGKIMFKNVIYIGHNLIPMVVLIVPMLTVMVQLEAHYAFGPSPVGEVQVLTVELDEGAAESPRDIQLTLPEGVVLDAPPVRTADGEAYFRVKAETAGDHELALTIGEHSITKGWAVGGEARKVPVRRTKSWEAFLYPGEGGIPAAVPVSEISMHYPERDLGWLPGGEMGILLVFFGLSLVAGFALKDVFGVTL